MKVVIVDAASEQLDQVLNILKDYRYEVFHFDNGKDAFEFCLANQPEILLTELNVPSINGIQLFGRLRKNPVLSEIPIIFMTKENNLEERIKSMQLGIEDYIYKPYVPEEVAARIDMIFQELEIIDQLRTFDDSGFSGHLTEMNLVDLIQTMELGEKSGIIHVMRNSDDGYIYMDRGQVIDAYLEGFQAEEALTALLTWLEGTFQVSLQTINNERTITKTNRDILMNGTKLIQEWRELANQLPQLNSQLVAARSEKVDLEPFEKKVYMIFSEPTPIIRAVQIIKTDGILVLKTIKDLIRKNYLVVSQTTAGHYDNTELYKRLKSSPENKSLHFRIASFFLKRKEPSGLSNPNNRSRRKKNGKLDHQITLSKGELLMIRQNIISE